MGEWPGASAHETAPSPHTTELNHYSSITMKKALSITRGESIMRYIGGKRVIQRYIVKGRIAERFITVVLLFQLTNLSGDLNSLFSHCFKKSKYLC